MRTSYTLAGTLAIALTATSASAAHLQPHLLFSARMNAAQQVPTNSSTALGLGGLTLNASRDTLCVNISWTGLTSTLTGLHIHEGLPGINGPVLVDLVPFIANDHVMTTITGSALTPALIGMHLRGELYLNLHTTNNPNGEIRGQIIPEADLAFVANLNGMQQVPMVSTGAFGLGTFLLAKHNGVLKISATFTGLSGAITAAHFHSGAPGVSGGVVQDLFSLVNGNTIIGDVDPAAFLADLLAGNIYLNVHTALNPNGEIRGQLVAPVGVAFDAMLNGAQEVPPVATTAKGSGSFVATWDLDSVWYDVVVENLSGPITGAHLHNASVGVGGPVVIDLGSGINGNRISGWITTATAGEIIELLEGNLYVNVHTLMNPNGEIRGQVYRYIREGYTVMLDGSQEVPPNTSTAKGSGIVSVDRGQSNAHVMFVVNPDMVQGAHFHLGEPGMNGPVIFDMTSLLVNNGVFTYWKSTDATPFTTARSIQFRNDSLYLNVHTQDYPNGEIRGQVRRGAVCTESSVGIFDRADRSGKLSVWPVPVFDQLTVALPLGIEDGAALELVNMLGMTVGQRGVNASTTRMTIDVTQLPAGLYFVRITDSDRSYVARFTKD